MAGPVTASGVNIAGEVRFLTSNFNVIIWMGIVSMVNFGHFAAYIPLFNPIFADTILILTRHAMGRYRFIASEARFPVPNKTCFKPLLYIGNYSYLS